MRRVLALLALLVAGALVGATARKLGLRINLSPSIPIGIYVARPLRANEHNIARGALVAICLDHPLAAWGRSRGYLRRGSCPDGSSPVGKPVFATEGDTIGVTRDGLSRNHVHISRTRPLDVDATGHRLPRVPPGRYLVAPDEIWIVSTYDPRSWDSRYYGPVRLTTVISLLRPLWVIRSRSGR